MSMPKYLILAFTGVDEDEFMNYLEHLKKDHHLKITIKEDEEKILYMGEDPAGNKELYGIEQKQED